MFGSHVPLTGPLAAGGEELSAGAKAYFKHINDQGGVNGHTIDYQAVNDRYNPQEAVAATRQLVQRDGAVAIVSTLGTATGLAVLPYLEQQNVAYVAALSGDARLLGAKPDSVTFGVAPTGLEMGGSLGRYAVEEVGAERVAAFYQNDAYGTDGRDGFRAQAEEAGAEYVADAPYEVGNTNYSAQIRRLRQAKPDVVCLYVLPSTAAEFLTQTNTIPLCRWHNVFMPKIHYPQVITEDPQELKELEKQHRYSHLFQRVRMLRLLQSEACSNLGEAARALGYSWRQCQRWFASYREGGLEELLKSRVGERGRQELVTPEAFGGSGGGHEAWGDRYDLSG